MMQIIEVLPGDSKNIDRFLNLPFILYRGVEHWVPPLSVDTSKYFDRRKNSYYQHGDASFFLATNQDNEPVGRLAVLANRDYNEFNHDTSAFVHLFECVDDQAAATSLFSEAVQWSSQHNLTRLIGPKGFTSLDGLGLLIKGFEHRPALGLPYNPPYYQHLFESFGFKPTTDLVSGYISPNFVLSEKVLRAAELVKKRMNMKVVRFKSKRELLKMIPKLKEMYNNALIGTNGNTPMTEDDIRSLADQLLMFADPRLIKIITKDDQPVGFLLAYPDLSAAIQRTRGKVFPFGWIDLLIESKRSKWVNINGAAIVEEYRGRGGTALLFSEIYFSIREMGFEHAEVVQIGVENEKMQLELKNFGIDFYKTHRLYELNI